MAEPISITIAAVTAVRFCPLVRPRNSQRLEVLGAAKGIVAMIDKEEHQKHQKNASVTDLEASVNALKEDMSNYGLFLNTMFAEDANQRARIRLCSDPEGCEALNHLDVSLKAAQLLLEQNEVIETTLSASESTRVGPVKRPPIGELVTSLFRTTLTPNDGTIDKLMSTTKDVDICRGNCNRSFKRVWNLYQLYQQPPNRQASITSIRSDGIEGALDDVELAFYKRPFSVSAEGSVRVAFNSLSMLNRTSENSTKHMKLMKDIGHRWAQSGMDRNDFLGQPGKPISKIQALGRLQTSLFELIWSGTIEQMKRPQNIEILAQEKSEFKTELEIRHRFLWNGQSWEVIVPQRAHWRTYSAI
ncbi:hypothetical protein PIIN_11047 [Serendipita indica DSM 11827]|uniref:Uncharacterized protein n=1 Tax=Serendipita indica (strain DSM 11827) TaxID=1109443 RepID=G4U0G9_SERID|nr:hypothetical protein PIIN_11047 [Serendipita indica DSM 11827]